MSNLVETFSATDKLMCARRELRMRRQVYPRWVAQGKMKLDHAEREIAIMEAIADDYARAADQMSLPL